MRALLFGSSARRGATGWTDGARIVSLLTTARPDVVIEGESPCGGADRLVRIAAESLGIPVDPYPQRDDVDGPRGFLRRNERMHREGRPHVAAGFVSGRVGSPLSGGSAHMADVCRRAGTPVVVYREDGIELPPQHGAPLRDDLATALGIVRGLYRICPDVEPAGRALRAAWDAERARAPVGDVVVMARGALGEVEKIAGEQSRVGPWLAVAAGVLRRW